MNQILGDMKHGDIYDKCREKQRKWNESRRGKTHAANTLSECTQWIHLSDAVERGTISPMEAYESLALDYVPENLKIRPSAYAHLL